jgi:hypothetical protein
VKLGEARVLIILKIKIMKINEQLIRAILVSEEAYEKIDKTTEILDNFAVSFSLFCAENYHYQDGNWWNKNYVDESLTIEELLKIFKTRSNT